MLTHPGHTVTPKTLCPSIIQEHDFTKQQECVSLWCAGWEVPVHLAAEEHDHAIHHPGQGAGQVHSWAWDCQLQTVQLHYSALCGGV